MILCLMPLSFKAILAEEENLSPIEKIEWGIEESTQTSQEETTLEDTNLEAKTENITTLETQPKVTTEGQVSQNLPKVENPLELLDIIRDPALQTSSNYYLVNFTEQNVQMDMIAYMGQGDYGYLTYQQPPYMPRTLLVKTNQDKVEDVYMAIETLITYATDAINNHSEVYEKSPIMDFYVYAQEHYQDLTKKYIHLDSTFDDAQDKYIQVQKLDDFVLELLTAFLKDYQDKVEFQAEQNTGVLNLEGETSEQFTSLFKQYQETYPELDPILNNLEKGIQGTLTFNYSSYEIGIGLLSQVSDGQTNGLEYYIKPVQADIEIPNPDQIVSDQKFVDLVGFDVLSQFQEFEDTIQIEQFNLEGE